MTVGENIKRIRKEKCLTQKKLGELCGIAESNIRKYENGKQNPKIETIGKIADALGVPEYELRGLDGSIRVNITPEVKEISRIQNKLLTDRENVTTEELEILKNYYTSKQLEGIAEIFDTSDVGITPSGDIVYMDSDIAEYNRIIDKQKNGEGFTPYDRHFISDYIDKSPLVRTWFIENGLKSKEKKLNRIQSAYERLNENGRKEAVKRIEELTEIERYTKPEEWVKGRMAKEEVDKAVKAYLNDEATNEPPQK